MSHSCSSNAQGQEKPIEQNKLTTLPNSSLLPKIQKGYVDQKLQTANLQNKSSMVLQRILSLQLQHGNCFTCDQQQQSQQEIISMKVTIIIENYLWKCFQIQKEVLLQLFDVCQRHIKFHADNEKNVTNHWISFTSLQQAQKSTQRWNLLGENYHAQILFGNEQESNFYKFETSFDFDAGYEISQRQDSSFNTNQHSNHHQIEYLDQESIWNQSSITFNYELFLEEQSFQQSEYLRTLLFGSSLYNNLFVIDEAKDFNYQIEYDFEGSYNMTSFGNFLLFNNGIDQDENTNIQPDWSIQMNINNYRSAFQCWAEYRFSSNAYTIWEKSKLKPWLWIPLQSNPNEWVQLQFFYPCQWAGIQVRGGWYPPSWVSSFKVIYSQDGGDWSNVDNGNTFQACTDSDTVVTIWFQTSIYGRKIRILPQTWQNAIYMYFDAIIIERT